MKKATLQLVPPPKPQPWHPDPDQRTALKYLVQHYNGGLLLDPGFGKTAITLGAFSVVLKAKKATRMLVIAPKRPMELVWQQELNKWSDFGHLRMVRLHSSYGKMDDLLRQDADIFVINPEGLPWLFKENRWQILGADVLCIDEISKFKHANTQRFKLLKPFLGTFRWRWGLTGSPASKGYLNLWAQAYILDQGRCLGQYITHYRRKYFVPTGYMGYDWQLMDKEKHGRDGAKEIQEAIKPLFLRLDMPATANVPKVKFNEIWVTLPPTARKAYDAMEEDMFVQLGTSDVAIARNAAAASGKCRQIANGGVYTEGQQVGRVRPTMELHDEKTQALLDLLDELQGSPVLVAYQFDHDLERIRKALGQDVPYIGGGVNTKRTVELEGMWNRGELPYLFAQPASISHGANLQNAGNHVAWYGLTWNFEDYDQFNRRVRRRGNTHSTVYVHHIIARGTVEEAVLATLQANDHTQKEIMDALRLYQAGRKVTDTKVRRRA